MPSRRSDNISTTIRRQIVLSSLLVSCITLAILLFFNDREIRAQERQAAFQRIENHVILMRALLQVADYTTLVQAVKFTVEDKNIHAVRVESPGGNKLAQAGLFDGAKVAVETRSFDIFSASDASIPVGRIYVEAVFPRTVVFSVSPTVLIPTGLAFMLIAVLLSWRLKEHITRPLRQVYEAAKQADTRHWPIADIEGPREVRLLNQALKGKIEANQRYTAALHSANDKLQAQLAVNENTQNALLRAQKLESVGRLAGGVAHDFNNILGVILGNLEIVKLKGIPPEFEKPYRSIFNATLRGAKLSKNMLAFAKRSKLNPTLVSMEEVVGQLEEMTLRTLPSNIKIRFQTQKDLPKVRVDVSSAENAILNLIVNARDAIQGEGEITVSVTHQTTNTAQFDVGGEPITVQPYIMLCVKDTGVGMDESALQNIFEPFFTTKPMDKGSGLGLSMVLGFIKQSGGFVCVNSKEGQGTEVQLLFPVDEQQATQPEKPTQAAIMIPKQTHILLVEDNEDLRETLQTLLEHAGNRVSEAPNGQMAIDMLRNEGAPDIILSDMVMPGPVQGVDLAQWVSAEHPDLPVIFMSGLSEEHDQQFVPFVKFGRRLTKPVLIQDLLENIAALLDEAGKAAGKATGR